MERSPLPCRLLSFAPSLRTCPAFPHPPSVRVRVRVPGMVVVHSNVALAPPPARPASTGMADHPKFPRDHAKFRIHVSRWRRARIRGKLGIAV